MSGNKELEIWNSAISYSESLSVMRRVRGSMANMLSILRDSAAERVINGGELRVRNYKELEAATVLGVNKYVQFVDENYFFGRENIETLPEESRAVPLSRLEESRDDFYKAYNKAEDAIEKLASAKTPDEVNSVEYLFF